MAIASHFDKFWKLNSNRDFRFNYDCFFHSTSFHLGHLSIPATNMSIRTCSKRFGALLQRQQCLVHHTKRRCYASTATAASSLPADMKNAIEVSRATMRDHIGYSHILTERGFSLQRRSSIRLSNCSTPRLAIPLHGPDVRPATARRVAVGVFGEPRLGRPDFRHPRARALQERAGAVRLRERGQGRL